METRKKFLEQLKELKQDVFAMGTLVIDELRASFKAFEEHDTDAIKRILKKDKKIDQAMLDIEDRCLTLLATQQPVAQDLRIILAANKLAAHLERMGDHAKYLARVINSIRPETIAKVVRPLEKMLNTALDMLIHALKIFNGVEQGAIREIARQDDIIDLVHQNLYRSIISMMQENRTGRDFEGLEEDIELLFLNRFLERFGDHVTFICEAIYYAEEGTHVKFNV